MVHHVIAPARIVAKQSQGATNWPASGGSPTAIFRESVAVGAKSAQHHQMVVGRADLGAQPPVKLYRAPVFVEMA